METQKAKGTTISRISVNDMTKAKELFVDILGMEIEDEKPEYGWMEVAGKEGSRIGIGKAREDMEAGKNAVISIDVDDLEQMMAYMKTKGIQFYGEVIELPKVKMVLFSDSDGNKFLLVQSLK